ncbi:protein HAPLESS 2 isoform X3 [Olea europaea var. sylvestris]|uniref:protein HAPLESS 2 isoform X3 n=1 Tax=Olea europaea var. sylvestris TaxID=158386 RepID=UPI000C1D3FD5|nr:protein HAPLESS 2 isoform X3 [Olea europaea var. sylvestris]
MKSLILITIISFSIFNYTFATQILSKSKLEKCEKVSDSQGLNCTSKIILDLAVPSESSGREASMVAEIVEAEENSTNMRTLRVPPVITINKSAAYALYELTYIRDVAYKPQEFYVQTRKCEPEAGADIVKICERLRDENGHIIEHTQPTCCPCGDQRRVPSSCGNFFDKLMKGKANTAHCLRFPGDWFHVFGLGQRSIGFSIRIEVKTRTKTAEVIVGPENRTAISSDNFLRVNLIGDYIGYTDIPQFDDFYLVIPRQADQNRISRNQIPLYCVQGRFDRINQHPEAGSRAFSIGITEVLNTNLLVELSADDIEFVYQRSPGKILGITVPTFEALTQFGIATITTKNIGELEASYSLTFDCSSGVSQMEEQFYIMKPTEVITRSFKLYPTTDQAAKYVCAAILKDSDFSEADRAECQFTTTTTVLDNGSQIPFQPPKTSINGFFESVEEIWSRFWTGMADFITGKSCSRGKCLGFFDFSCHIQYICMSWILMFGLFLAIFPAAVVLLWLLHQKGLFDPLYDWWEDHMWTSEQRNREIGNHGGDADLLLSQYKKNHKHDARHHKHEARNRRRNIHSEHGHNHLIGESSYHHYLHHVHKDKHKHGKIKSSGTVRDIHLSRRDDDDVRYHRKRNERKSHGRDY